MEYNTNNASRGEIDESNMQILHITFSKYRPTRVYNLDVIISVGYRVHSQEGVIFRKWATSVLKEYLIKGYVVRSNLAQQKYENLKALVEVVGRTMGYRRNAFMPLTKTPWKPSSAFGTNMATAIFSV